jgi:hypothetical protein
MYVAPASEKEGARHFPLAKEEGLVVLHRALGLSTNKKKKKKANRVLSFLSIVVAGSS